MLVAKALAGDSGLERRGTSYMAEKKKEDSKTGEAGLSLEELDRLYEQSFKDIEEKRIVKGKIVKVDEREATIDLGLKSEGVISLSEFEEPLEVQVGSEVEVFLEDVEDQDGFPVISKQKADFLKVWDLIKESHEKGTRVEGKVMKRVKGGMICNVFGVEAFLPGSQIDLQPVRDMDSLIGENLDLRIIKLNWKRRNIVVSRRVLLEEERDRQRRELLRTIEKGQVREGVVKNITDFGAFIDLGGLDGLLHITDMSWGRVMHPSELLAVNDKVKVMITGIDWEKERVSLGMKQLVPYPWQDIETKYPVGGKVRGKVVSITDYGAFVELEKGVEGLVHISEMSWTQHIKHPSQVVAIGDVIEVVVLSIEKEKERISLGMKQTTPDPWSTVEQTHPVGSKVFGRVRNLTGFGAFIEIEEGIDGLLHLSDISWTKKIEHPGEVLKKGEKVEVIVLRVDREQRRISLGMKQLSDDPLREFVSRQKVGSHLEADIVEVTEDGVVVDLGNEITSFVPLSQLEREAQSALEAYKVGERLALKLTDVDFKSRRVSLSERAHYQEKEREEIDEYLGRKEGKAKLGDAMGELLPEEEKRGKRSKRK